MQPFIALSLLLLISLHNIQAKRGKHYHEAGGQGNHKQEVDDNSKATIKAHCAKNPDHCKGQSAEHKEKRKNVKNNAVSALKMIQPGISDADADAAVEARLAKIQEAKRAWYAKEGLEEIEPADDGLWGGDVFISIEEAEAIIASYSSKNKRSASNFFENNPTRRLTMPVHYWIADNFAPVQKQVIDVGLATLANQTNGCVRFQKDSTQANASQVWYLQSGGTGGGGSSGGYPNGIFMVHLDAANSTTDVGLTLMYGVHHETIHVLGGMHEFGRTDRDKYIQMLWGNISANNWAAYAIAFNSTSYGVPFDYNSVMMYWNVYSNVTHGSTMRALNPAVPEFFGPSYTATGNDTLQLKRMYCPTSDPWCYDDLSECGTYALSGQWVLNGWGFDCSLPTVQNPCARSCGCV